MVGWLGRRFSAVVLAATVALAPGAGQSESLTDALILAYKHSQLLEQNRALLRATDEDVATAIAALRPTINFVASSNFSVTHSASPTAPAFAQNLSTSAQLTYEITIFDFGRSRLAVEAAKETVLATRAALVDLEQQVLFSAVQAYLNVLSAFETVSVRQNNVRVITEELRAARDRFEVGEVTRTDVSIAEARLAGARAQLASAQGDLMIAREAYKAAVGRYPGTLFRPPSPPMTVNTEAAAKAVAERGHPRILQAQHQVTTAELNVARAEAAMKPRLSGSLSTGVTSSDRLDTFGSASSSLTLGAGVSLSAPIYQGGALSASLRRAIAQRDAARAGLLQTMLQVSQNVGNAWAQLAVAQASLQSSVQQVRAAQLAYDGVREEARLGARTTLDVLDAEQELLDAKVSAITAETSRYIAVYGVLSAMGLLTVEHLGLGIATYDPAAYYETVKDAPVRHVSPQGEKLDRVLERLFKDE
ncbi:MAG: TolC family outer membrane protein [Paracoccaceae bacterium]